MSKAAFWRALDVSRPGGSSRSTGCGRISGFAFRCDHPREHHLLPNSSASGPPAGVVRADRPLLRLRPGDGKYRHKTYISGTDGDDRFHGAPRHYGLRVSRLF